MLILSLCSSALLALPAPVAAPVQGSLPNTDGWAAVTCGTRSIYPAAEQYTFGLIDVNAPVFGAAHYNAPMYHDASWIADEIGNVFGVTWDNARNIYVTATSNVEGYAVAGTLNDAIWRYGDIGGGANDLGAAGTVYKIDGQTGAVSVFAQLPQQQSIVRSKNYGARLTGPGLGNIAYDTNHDQFFVTNDEDGTIYRIDNTGSVLSTFDPMGADDGTAGFAPRGERLWGIGLINGRVYYSVWPAEDAQPTVRSVALVGGDFDAGTDQLEFTASFLNVGHPISDIEFSADGRMLVGQRTMASFDNFGLTYSELDVYNHRTSTAVFENNGGWSEIRDWGISLLGGNTPESYGGTDWADLNGVNDVVWTSSADMIQTSGGSHGIAGIAYTDMTTDPAAIGAPICPIQYDPNATGDPKGLGGDVSIIGRTRPICTGLFVLGSVDTNLPSCNHPTDASLTGDVPAAGQVWCWDLTSQFPNTQYWLYGSIGKPGQPQYDLFGLCDIWPNVFALIDIATGQTDGAGNRSGCLMIPNDPAIIGLSVVMQVRLCDPTFQGQGPIPGVPDFFSNGMCITIGCP